MEKAKVYFYEIDVGIFTSNYLF